MAFLEHICCIMRAYFEGGAHYVGGVLEVQHHPSQLYTILHNTTPPKFHLIVALLQKMLDLCGWISIIVFCMKGFTKSLEVFHDEQYRAADYGIIYYVAGTASQSLNAVVQQQSQDIAEHINRLSYAWLHCQVVYLDADNSLFASAAEPRLYSAVLPTTDEIDGYSFLVATLVGCDTDCIQSVFTAYYSTLQHILDEILDEGRFSRTHIDEVEDFAPVEMMKEIRFSISPRTFSLDSFDSLVIDIPAPRTHLSRIELTPDKHRLMLTDYQEEIKVGAQIKALYVLFLLHPQGILMRRIGDYKEEYKQLYFKMSNRSDADSMYASIDRLLDRFNSKAMNVKKSQCNSILRELIPEDDLRQYYEIQAPRHRPHKITLDRQLVSIPKSLLQSSK